MSKHDDQRRCGACDRLSDSSQAHEGLIPVGEPLRVFGLAAKVWAINYRCKACARLWHLRWPAEASRGFQPGHFTA